MDRQDIQDSFEKLDLRLAGLSCISMLIFCFVMMFTVVTRLTSSITLHVLHSPSGVVAAVSSRALRTYAGGDTGVYTCFALFYDPAPGAPNTFTTRAGLPAATAHEGTS